jgi:uncharacterized protein YkwD
MAAPSRYWAGMHPNPIDILLAAIVLFGAWSGWSRGFLFSALDLLTLAISLGAAFFGYRSASGWVARFAPNLGVWLVPLAFVALFLLVHFLLGGVVLRLLLRLPRRVHANAVNRALGVLPGIANGAIHAIVAAVLLLTLPLGAHVGNWAQESALAPRLARPAEWAEVELSPIFDPVVQRTMHAVTTDPESRERIALPFRDAQGEPRPDLEEQMLALVNAERRSAGRPPLKADPILTELARAHSRDMLARGYFAHITPEGQDLSGRMQQAHIGYLAAGENLALAPSLYTAHRGLMHSPGHRANILRPQFGRVGIGVLDAGSHGLMVTQEFRN